MTSDHLFFFFALFVVSGIFLWLLGTASFDRRLGAGSLYRAPWLGYALFVGFLQFSHLVFPIQKGVSITIVAGLALIAFCALLFGGALKEWTAQRAAAAFGSVALLLGIFVPVLNGCTKSMCHTDLGLYYLKLIRWIQTFPIVPGLVNVQEQLAFNQNAFLITSLFDSLVPNRWGLFLIAGFLPWLGLSLSMFAIVRVLFMHFWKRGSAPAMEIAYAISLPAWLSTLATSSLSSASPDCIITCLSIHFFLVFACYVVSDDEKEWMRSLGEILLLGVTCVSVKSSSLGLVLGVWLISAGLLFIKGRGNLTLACVMIHLFLVFACFLFVSQEGLGEVLVIGAACLCIKLTSFGFVLTIWAIAAAVTIRKRDWQSLLNRRMVSALGLSAILLCVWVYRGVVLSGYPFFPSSVLAAPVEWRVPEPVMKGFQDYILLWARFPHGDAATALESIGWIPHWLARVIPNQYQFAWPIQVGLASALALSLFQPNRPEILNSLRRNMILISPLFGFTLLWFVTAPDVRYFGPLAWLFAISPALLWVSRRFSEAFVACGSVLCLSAVPIACFSWENRWLWITRERILPQIPIVELEVSTNRHGLAIWYAKEGNKSFDAPLPSSWGFAPDLCLLDPKRGLSGGFKHVESPLPQPT